MDIFNYEIAHPIEGITPTPYNSILFLNEKGIMVGANSCISIYADNGGTDTGTTTTGDETTGGTGGGRNATTSIGGDSGTKVTLIIADKDSYNNGYLMGFTPVSEGKWSSGEASQVGRYPIYFTHGIATEFTGASQDGSGKDTKDISSMLIKGGAAAYDVDNGIYGKIISAFTLDWWGSIGSEQQIEHVLGIELYEDIKGNAEKEEANKKTLATLLKIMATVHPEMLSDNPDLQKIIDGTGGGNKDYIFLIEPLVPVNYASGGNSLLSILNYASTIKGESVSVDSDFYKTIKKISTGRDGWKWIKSVLVGRIDPDTKKLSDLWTSGSGNTIASKIYYSGPATSETSSIV
ncbi:hypothetical protein AGMMS49975_06450 [Clostridia bacterium]|nr:hypothetical protein AGMMS49975_06450 [Clostridia bacterium]